MKKFLFTLITLFLVTTAACANGVAKGAEMKIKIEITSGGSRLGRSGSDLAKYAKGADFKGGKDFTYKSGADINKYVEGLLK